MNKKKAGLLIILLFLIIGLGSFVFANPDNQENLEEREIEGRDRNGSDSEDNRENEESESDTLLTAETDNEVGNNNQNGNNTLFGNNGFTNTPNTSDNQGTVEYDYYADALKAVQNAESSLCQGDVDYAASLVDRVTNQSQKDELNSRLEAVQDIIDVTALIERLENMVTNSTNRDDILESIDYRNDEKIEELVNNLVSGTAKDNLVDRLETVNKILNDNKVPVISGIDNNSFTSSDVSLTITDTNEVTTTVTLNDNEVDYTDTFTDEGTYVVTVVDAAFNETTLTFTIDRTLPSITGFEDGFYNNKTEIVYVRDTNLETVTINGTEYEHDGKYFEKKLTADGVYTVVATDKAGNTATKTVTIDKTAPVITGVENGKRYTSSVTPVITDANLVSVTLNGEEFTSGTTISEKGEYTLIATDITGNKTIVEFSITKIYTSIELTAPESLVYDGKAKEFTAIIKDENGNVLDIALNVVYEAEDGTRGDAINVGKYTAIVYFGGNDTYEKQYARKSFEITKADTVFEFTAPESLVYDGSAKEYTVVLKDQHGNVIDDNYKVVYEAEDGTRGDAINARKYTVIAHYAGDNNYNGTYKRERFEITKADTVFEFTAPESLVYDESVKEYTVVLKDQHGNVIDDNYKVVYEAEDGTRGDAINAGKYTVIAHYAGDNNYNGAYKRESFEITKATPTIELTEPTSLVYDRNTKSYGIKVVGADGNEIENPNMVVVYKKGSGIIYNSNNADKGSLPINAGSYTLGIYVRENDNYTRADKWINFEISKADTEFEFTAPESLEYDGVSKEYTVVLKDQHGNILDDKYDAVYEAEDGTRGDAINEGKYTVIAHYAGDNNYNGTYKRETFEILPSSLNLVAKAVGSNLIDESGNTINNFNAFAIKFDKDLTFNYFSTNQKYIIEMEYSTDGVTYTKSSYVYNNVYNGLNDANVNKYVQFFGSYTIPANSSIHWNGTSVGTRWTDIYEAIKATKDTDNKVYVRTVFTVVQPTFTKKFILDPVVYSKGGYEVTPRGLPTL